MARTPFRRGVPINQVPQTCIQSCNIRNPCRLKKLQRSAALPWDINLVVKPNTMGVAQSSKGTDRNTHTNVEEQKQVQRSQPRGIHLAPLSTAPADAVASTGLSLSRCTSRRPVCRRCKAPAAHSPCVPGSFVQPEGATSTETIRQSFLQRSAKRERDKKSHRPRSGDKNREGNETDMDTSANK